MISFNYIAVPLKSLHSTRRNPKCVTGATRSCSTYGAWKKKHVAYNREYEEQGTVRSYQKGTIITRWPRAFPSMFLSSSQESWKTNAVYSVPGTDASADPFTHSIHIYNWFHWHCCIPRQRLESTYSDMLASLCSLRHWTECRELWPKS